MHHQRRFPSSPLLAVLVAAMLLLAACGNGGSNQTDTDEASMAESTGAETGDADRGIAALTDADCRQYARAFQEAPAVTDPDSLDSIADLADILDDAADRVPNEISDDFRVLADAYRSFSDAMGDLDLDFNDPASMAALGPEDFEALEEAGQSFDSDELEEATANIEAFLTENCT